MLFKFCIILSKSSIFENFDNIFVIFLNWLYILTIKQLFYIIFNISISNSIKKKLKSKYLFGQM